MSLSAQVHPLTLPPRSDPTVRAIGAEWRALTSSSERATNGAGERTLVACSAGGDSSALAIALTVAAGKRASELLVIAHVRHDLRAKEFADEDARRASVLADALGLPFAIAAVSVSGQPGNAESLARAGRYAQLTQLAADHQCWFVATGHNLHDQAESVVMALLRGAGPRGLSGIATARRLSRCVTLIRPMLSTSPLQARSLCERSGWVFSNDHTNASQKQLRSRVRSQILPLIAQMRPSGIEQVARSAAACANASHALEAVVRRTLRRAEHAHASTPGWRWDRSLLRSPCMSIEMLRTVLWSALRNTGDGPSRGADSVTQREINAVARSIASGATDPKEFKIGCWRVAVSAHHVVVHIADDRTVG